jgi:hypothetical protein
VLGHSIERQYFVIVTDKGEEITDAWVFWSLAEAGYGVSINAETGAIFCCLQYIKTP